MSKLKKIIKKTLGIKDASSYLLSLSPDEFNMLLISIMREKSNQMDPSDAMKMIMDFDNKLYHLDGDVAERYGNGVHAKHRHINYHKFFTSNIKPTDRVLDIGCSRGELTNDIAKQASKGHVYGIEIEEPKYKQAVRKYQRDNLTFIHGDATKVFPKEKIDVITLSNVLEHIEHRTKLLKTLNEKYKPNRFLIRVPLFERDWRVPLKKELGLDYRLDDTHFIEYTLEIFDEEMAKAGLRIDKLEVRWGEIRAVIEPLKTHKN